MLNFVELIANNLLKKDWKFIERSDFLSLHKKKGNKEDLYFID